MGWLDAMAAHPSRAHEHLYKHCGQQFCQKLSGELGWSRVWMTCSLGDQMEAWGSFINALMLPYSTNKQYLDPSPQL